MTNCIYRFKCSGYPFQCFACKHNTERNNYFEPIDIHPRTNHTKQPKVGIRINENGSK